MAKNGENSADSRRRKLVFELRSLRKGSGLTRWKLETARQLRAVLAEQTGIEAQHLTPAQLHAYLLEQLNKLGESIEAHAVRNAYALGHEDNPGKLTERRLAFAEKLGRHPDTIEAHENHGLDELANHLLSFQLAIESGETGDQWQLSHIERTTNAARNMVAQGLADLYGLGTHAPEILATFGRRPSPYLDANVELVLLPSQRSKDWFVYKFRLAFRAQLDHFLIAIVQSAHDTEALMAAGVVDDVIQINATSDIDRELATIAQDCSLLLKDTKNGTQQQLDLVPLDELAARDLLKEAWRVDGTSCRILKAELPERSRHQDLYYEFRCSVELHVYNEQFVYWNAPTLMYLNNITIDVSRFPNRNTWKFYMLPFLGATLPGAVEPTGDRYTLTAGCWVMQGHGIAINWHETA